MVGLGIMSLTSKTRSVRIKSSTHKARIVATLEVAVEGLTGSLLPLDAAPLHLHHRLLVGVEAETGFAAEGCTPTTVDVVGQVLGHRGPTSDHLTDGRERRHPGLGLRQLRLARLPWVGLTVAREGLLYRLDHLASLNNPMVDLLATLAKDP